MAVWNNLDVNQLQLFSLLALLALGTVDMILDKYSCIALAGVATEYLLYGFSEGGGADVQQLDNLLRSLNFTQEKADSQIRWAVLNTVTLLRRHEQARSKLAEAMSSGMSVGECINIIENELMNVRDI